MHSNKPTEVDSMNRLRVQAENKAALYRRALELACEGDSDKVAFFVSEADADRPNDPHDDLTPVAWRFKLREDGDWHLDEEKPHHPERLYCVEPLYAHAGVPACPKGGE